MDMIRKDTRVHRKNSSSAASRSNSVSQRRYYGSWEQLLERTEVDWEILLKGRFNYYV